MSNHESWIELADLYSLDSLRGEELSQFESHLQGGCSTCSEHLAEVYNALTLMPESLSAVSAPAALKTKIMEQVALEPKIDMPQMSEPSLFQSATFYWTVAVLAVVAASVAFVLWFGGQSQVSEVVEEGAPTVSDLVDPLEEPLFPELVMDPVMPVPFVQPTSPVQPQMRIEAPPVKPVVDTQDDVLDGFKDTEDLDEWTSLFEGDSPDISSEVGQPIIQQHDQPGHEFKE